MLNRAIEQGNVTNKQTSNIKIYRSASQTINIKIQINIQFSQNVAFLELPYLGSKSPLDDGHRIFED